MKKSINEVIQTKYGTALFPLLLESLSGLLIEPCKSSVDKQEAMLKIVLKNKTQLTCSVYRTGKITFQGKYSEEGQKLVSLIERKIK